MYEYFLIFKKRNQIQKSIVKYLSRYIKKKKIRKSTKMKSENNKNENAFLLPKSEKDFFFFFLVDVKRI